MSLPKLYWWSAHPILACLKILSLFLKDSFAGYTILVDNYFPLVSRFSCYRWKVSCPQSLFFLLVNLFISDCIFSLTMLSCRFIMFYMDGFELSTCFLNSWQFTTFINFEKFLAIIFLIIAFSLLHSFPAATNLAQNNKNSFLHSSRGQNPLISMFRLKSRY